MTAPMFSVLVPVYRTPLRYLRLMVDSVLAQRFSDFQLLLVDDGSGRPELTAELAGMAARDERIELLPQAVNAGIVRASAAGLAAATGEFVALVDHDDELLPDALELFARAILADDQLDYLYSDEAIIDPEGALLGNFVKPDFSPTRLLGQMYTGHLAVFRRSLLTEIGGFRDGFDGSQDYDLVLRASERARAIGHIPKALYRWRTLPTSVSHSANNEHVFAAARRALTEHLDRTATVAQVVQTDSTGRYRLDRPLPDELRVDVILPCTGGRTFARGADRPALAAALDAVAAAGAGLDDLGAVVIGAPGAAVDRPSSWPGRWLTVEHPHPAGPAAVNRAVAASSAEYVVLALEGLAAFGAQADGNRALSGARAEGGDRADVGERAESGAPAAVGERAESGDRAEGGDQGELTRLVALAADRRIGAVGPQLVDGGGRLSSAGVTFAAMLPAPIGRGCDLDDPGPFGALQVDRDVLALAPGVLVINRSLYLQVGGLSVRMTLAAAWLDLCFKTAAMDRRTVVCADARAVFDRPAALPEPASAAELGERWRRAVARDPYWV